MLLVTKKPAGGSIIQWVASQLLGWGGERRLKRTSFFIRKDESVCIQEALSSDAYSEYV